MRPIKFKAISKINGWLLADYVQEAAELNQASIARSLMDKLEIPADLNQALAKSNGPSGFEILRAKEYAQWTDEDKKNTLQTITNGAHKTIAGMIAADVKYG